MPRRAWPSLGEWRFEPLVRALDSFGRYRPIARDKRETPTNDGEAHCQRATDEFSPSRR
jgi:hypothetical protein